MAYSGGCLFGWPVLLPQYQGTFNYVGGWTTSMAYMSPTTASANLQQAYGETHDGCWRPLEWAVNDTPGGNTSFRRIITDKTRVLFGANFALLFSVHNPQNPTLPTLPADAYTVYTALTAGSSFAAATGYTVLRQSVSSFGQGGVGAGERVLITDLPMGFTGIETDGLLSTWNGNGGLFGELVGVSISELPNNQDLVSYRREIRNPSQKTITTLDGSKRIFVTGGAGVDISATWRWSDDGTLAKEISTTILRATSYGTPYFVYIPAGIWYGGPYLDLVVPTSTPTITMPAPGVYELTLQGECQP